MNINKNWHPNFPPDLSNCHEEPIRIPGAIQTFGILIGYDSDQVVRLFSENALQFFPQLEDFESRDLPIDSIAKVSELADTNTYVEENDRRLVNVEFNAQTYFGAVYRSGDLEILEIEIQSGTTKTDAQSYLSNMPRMMKDIRGMKSIGELADFTAKKIKKMTGFDRVMVYRFDHEWNGKVIAEAKETKLEPLLGMHFPASDIPPQARALYERNWIRIIPTINYQPARLLPAARQDVDLSDSVLRSVSPIHIEYLRNMGVQASMSISLIVDGKLWGLVACHHYSDHLVGLDVRFGCEAYGQLVSWYINAIQAAETAQNIRVGELRLHRVLEAFSGNPNFIDAAKTVEKDLLDLFSADGMLIRLGDESVAIGNAPNQTLANMVAKSLEGYSILNPLVTHETTSVIDLGLVSDAAGLMTLPLAPKHNYYILCTRKEIKQSVDWAGNPHQKLQTDFLDPKQRLMPRGSFELWKELHEGQSLPWSNDTIDLFKRFGLLFVKIVIERKELAQKSNKELRALNQAKDEFVAMVSHELRTPLNAIIGWTDLAISGELPDDKISDALKIIQRNARSQNQLIGDLLDISRIISGKMKLSVKNMKVSDVAEAVALSFVPAADAKLVKIIKHFDQDSDSIIGDPNRIQQVIWNLLSNAVKFSPKNSNIWLNVRRSNSQIEIEVKDMGVGIEPQYLDKIFSRFEQVDSSTTRRSGGLGLGLAICRHIVELHGGSIRAHSDGLGTGTSIVARFPIGPILPEEKLDPFPLKDSFTDQPEIDTQSDRLKGEIILIVEDEPDAIHFLEILISRHGAKTFTARNGADALEILKMHGDEINVVLSDVGMPMMDGYQLASAVRASANPNIRGLCLVALTAFGRPQDRITALRAGFDSYIAKPVMQEELLAVLESACKSKKRQ